MIKLSDFYISVFKSMFGRYLLYAVNFISMMVLARIFTPEVFGVVSAIMVFFVFFQLMSEAGLGPAIINLHSLSPEDRNGLFGLTLAIGIVFALVFSALGGVFVSFYGLPRVNEVVPYVAVALIFFSAAIVPNALLLREKAFFRICISGIAAEVISTVSVIVLNKRIDSLHALAAKGAISSVTSFLLVWCFSGKTEFGRPMPGVRFAAVKPLLKFSGYQFGFNFINYFSRNLDNILVGKYMGAGMLGVYDKAYQLMKYPMMLLTFAMTPAIQPTISKYSHDLQQVETINRDFTFRLSIIGAAAGLAVYSLSEFIVLVMLGNQWVEVIPIIRILSIAIPVQVVLSTSGSFFQGLNRADLLFLSGTLSAIVMIAAIVAGIIQRDISLVCWFLVAAFHLNFLQAYYLMYRKIFKAPLRSYLVRMSPAAIVVLGMTAHSLAK